MGTITVIGSASIDFLIQTKSLPTMGETVLGNSLSISFGGKGANQAVAASRLGANVNFIACVGNDDYANDIINNLKQNNISSQYITKIDTEKTGTAHIILYKNENSIIVIKGANDYLSSKIIDKFKNIIAKSDMILIQQEIPIKTIQYVVDLCFKLKVKILLNPAPFNKITLELINKVTFLTPNEHELKDLFPTKTLNSILKNYPNKLIVTRGSRGVSYFDGKKVKNIPAVKVRVVDTTGAGDTFNAAFATAIVNKKDIYQSITFANTVASLSVKKIGAQTGMPYIDEVKTLHNFNY